MDAVPATLVYCVDSCETGGRVLLLQRKKPPFVGQWVAPGGKLDPGEAPFQCAQRELLEETGLTAHHTQLRAIITETSPRPDFAWMIFAYRVDAFDGEPSGDEREGVLRWWPVDDLDAIDMPEADRIIMPIVLDHTGPPVELWFRYDQELRLVEQRRSG